jgi:hypothetical protein
MAPELFDNGKITEKVDVYSFGVLLWECLTGLVPWGSVPSPMQIIYYVGVLNQRLPVPRDCPEALRRLLEACWRESPRERPSFEEIAVVLRAEEERAAADPELRREMEEAESGEVRWQGAAARSSGEFEGTDAMDVDGSASGGTARGARAYAAAGGEGSNATVTSLASTWVAGPLDSQVFTSNGGSTVGTAPVDTT